MAKKKKSNAITFEELYGDDYKMQSSNVAKKNLQKLQQQREQQRQKQLEQETRNKTLKKSLNTLGKTMGGAAGNLLEYATREEDNKKKSFKYYVNTSALKEEAKKTTKKLSKDVQNKDWKSAYKDLKDARKGVNKSIRNTALDALGNVTEGSLNTFEGISDTGRYAAADILDIFNINDEKAQQLRKTAMENTTQGIIQDWNDIISGNLTREEGKSNAIQNLQKSSVLGNKSRQAFQGVGNSLTNAILSGAGGGGIAGDAAMFLSASGSARTEAYQNGAGNISSAIYALGSGSIETASEHLFDGLGDFARKMGFGSSAMGDAITDKFIKNMTTTLGKNLANLGLDVAGEGSEEVISGFGSSIMSALTYLSEDDYKKLANNEESMGTFLKNVLSLTAKNGVEYFTSGQAKEDFVGGAASSLLMSGTSAVKNTARGVESKTGYTETERKAIDNIIENRINEEQENKGSKLTAKEKMEINQKAHEEFTKGEISIEEIQQALGGETYTKYKEATDLKSNNETKLNEIKKEIDELEKDQAQKTLNWDKYQDLRNQLDELSNQDNSSEIEVLKTQLEDEVLQQVGDKDYNLQRSYYDREQRGQNFTIDESKISESNKDLYESAKKHLNNTIKTKKFVQAVANLNENSPINYRFTSTQELKDMGYDVDGKSVNGLAIKSKDSNTILINSDTLQAVETILGHETTHFLENSASYDELQKAIKEYDQETWNKLTEEFKELYKNVKDANIDQEVTAEMCGKLFGDEKFVSRLSENKNLFTKIRDVIEDLLVKFKGTDEEKALRKAQKAFEKTYREMDLSNVESKEQLSLIDDYKEVGDRKNLIKMRESIDLQMDKMEDKTSDEYKALASRLSEIDDAIYDLNSKTQYSLGTHYGDLGKGNDTYYWNMSQSNRSTGHFGTGTYFVKDENSNAGSKLEGRPSHKVEFNDYNLLKPLTNDEGFQVHDGLKAINNKLEYLNKKDIGKELSNLQNKYEITYDETYRDKIINILKDNGFNTLNAEEQIKNGYTYDGEKELFSMVDDFVGDIDSANYDYEKLKYILKFNGISEEQINNALEKVNETEKKYKKEQPSYDSKLDSLSTIFMKELGYNGIDTRDLSLLDNSTYGSVIYDLNKKETNKVQYSLSDDSQKENQFKIITETNPMIDEYHVGIRSAEDIKTWEEVLNSDDEVEGQFVWGDFSREDAEQALQDGEITIYSSKPIQNGEFVSTSFVQAEEYAGGDASKVYSKVVPLTDVAWINGDEGQYANVQMSLSNDIAPVRDSNLTYDIGLNQNKDVNTKLDDLNSKLDELTRNLSRNALNTLNNDAEMLRQTPSPEFATVLTSDYDIEAPSYNNLTEEEGLRMEELQRKNPMQLTDQERDELQMLQETEYDLSPNENQNGLKDIPIDEKLQNEEAKDIIINEAIGMRNELRSTIKGERGQIANNNSEYGDWYGITRQTTSTIGGLLDSGYSYMRLENGLNRIINGQPLSQASYDILEALDNQLLNGYTTMEGYRIEPNVTYQNALVNEQGDYDIDFVDYTDTTETQPTRQRVVEDIAPIAPERIDAGQRFIDNAIQKQELKPTTKFEEKKVNKMWGDFQERFVNRNYYIDKLSKDSGNKNIKFLGDQWNNQNQTSQYDIYEKQTDSNGKIIGKGLVEIFDQARKDGTYEAFNDYLFHKSNIERTARGIGSKVDSAVSEQLVQDYEQTYPQFKNYTDDLKVYTNNILNQQVESGIVSESTADFLKGTYQNYVPFMQDSDIDKYFAEQEDVRAFSSIRKAKGGASQDTLMGFEQALMKQTYAYKNSIALNNLLKEVANTLGTSNQTELGSEMISQDRENNNLFVDNQTGDKYIVAKINGEENYVKVSNEIFQELTRENENRIKNLEEQYSLITKPLQKLSNVRRNLLTSWNPLFLATNAIKDIQEAVINSKSPIRTLANFTGVNDMAIKELAMNSELAQQFKALYGSVTYNGDIDTSTTLKKAKNVAEKTVNFFGNINELIELAPRYAEFKASIEKGLSPQEAIYNAREVTTNFGRGGYISKALNRNGFTFLNASIQGLDKQIRNFTDADAKGKLEYIAKAALVGIAPAILNELAFGSGDDKDEEYEALPDYVKDNYYVMKIGKTWIRIPKGRMMSVLGSLARRSIELGEGDETALEGWGANAWSQLGVDPIQNNLLAPISQAFGSENGEAWYGGDIVPSRLQNRVAKEQYDSTTDKLSIFLGQLTGLSPYKINYVLEQYSGGFGDVALPMMTEATTSGASSFGEYLLAPISDKFVVNSVDDNKYAGDFYNLKEKLDKVSIEDTPEDVLKRKYLSSVSSEMSALYAEKREIQGNNSLSQKEKYDKVREIQKQINDIAQNALDTYKNVSVENNYASVNGVDYYLDKNGSWSKVNDSDVEISSGLTPQEKSVYFNTKNKISNIQAEYKTRKENASAQEKTNLNNSLRNEISNVIANSNFSDSQKYDFYNKYYGDEKTSARMQSMGFSFDSYINTSNYIANLKNTYSKDNGYSTQARKAKITSYIESQTLSVPQKIYLQKQAGYSVKSYKNYMYNWLNEQNLTAEEKTAIYEYLF